jgi:hypothetical protein
VARVLILFAHPGALPTAECGPWARQLADALGGQAEVTLSRLASAEWNWLLEVRAADLESAEAWLESPATRDTLLDLRLLGSRPRVVVAE